jgi:uncharacterized membrane protein
MLRRAMASVRDRQGLAARRSVIAAAAGIAVLVGTLVGGAQWPIAVSAAWGTTALVIVALVWVRIVGMDGAATKAHARAEDFSRALTDFAVITASIASLVAVGYLLVRAGKASGTDKALLIILAISVVAVSWTAVHTLYTVRYGDLFYRDPIGGIDFNGEELPDYWDFAYLAFTIGMTFQVSDTSLTSKRMRRTALRHAALSFVFVAVIIALTINGVASLLR